MNWDNLRGPILVLLGIGVFVAAISGFMVANNRYLQTTLLVCALGGLVTPFLLMFRQSDSNLRGAIPQRRAMHDSHRAAQYRRASRVYSVITAGSVFGLAYSVVSLNPSGIALTTATTLIFGLFWAGTRKQ